MFVVRAGRRIVGIVSSLAPKRDGHASPHQRRNYAIIRGVGGNDMATSSITANFKADESRAVNALSSGIAAVFRKIAPVDARAVLFGSRARGDANQDSDWDVLVLLGKDRITASDQDNIAYPIHEIGWEIDEMVNPVMYTMREWESKRGTPFYENVTREGVAL